MTKQAWRERELTLHRGHKHKLGPGRDGVYGRARVVRARELLHRRGRTQHARVQGQSTQARAHTRAYANSSATVHVGKHAQGTCTNSCVIATGSSETRSFGGANLALSRRHKRKQYTNRRTADSGAHKRRATPTKTRASLVFSSHVLAEHNALGHSARFRRDSRALGTP